MMRTVTTPAQQCGEADERATLLALLSREALGSIRLNPVTANLRTRRLGIE